MRTISSLIATVFILVGCASTGQDGKPLTSAEITQKREATLKMAQTGLASLIKLNPDVQKEISQAADYAVFNTTNVNVILIVLARGEGVLYDKRRQDPLFMKELKTGEGVGAGYQTQYQVLIFKKC